MSRLAASVALAGVAVIGVTAPAFASKGHDKPAVCHPTGKGWVLINPSQASSHIDETTGAPKHKHGGRVDVYAVAGACPVAPSTPTPTTPKPTNPETPCPTTTSVPVPTPPTPTSPSSTTRPSPTSTSPSPSQTYSTSTSPTVTEPPSSTTSGPAQP